MAVGQYLDTREAGEPTWVKRHLSPSRTKETRRQASVVEACDYLQRFVEDGWRENVDYISVIGDITVKELFSIGRDDQERGVARCRALFNAPVLNDEIAYTLWKTLQLARELEDSDGARRTNPQYLAILRSTAYNNSRSPRRPTLAIGPGRITEATPAERRSRPQQQSPLQSTTPSPPEPARQPSCEDCGSLAKPMRRATESSASVSRSASPSAEPESSRRHSSPVMELICAECGRHTPLSEPTSNPQSLGRYWKTRGSIRRVKKTLEAVGESLSYGYGYGQAGKS